MWIIFPFSFGNFLSFVLLGWSTNLISHTFMYLADALRIQGMHVQVHVFHGIWTHSLCVAIARFSSPGCINAENCFDTNQMSQTLIFSWQNTSIFFFIGKSLNPASLTLWLTNNLFLFVLHWSIVIAKTRPLCRICSRRTRKMFRYRMFNWFSAIKLDTTRNQFSNHTTCSHVQPLSLETNSCHVFYLRTWHILQLAPFACSHQHIIMGGMKTSITLTGSAFSILPLLAEG